MSDQTPPPANENELAERALIAILDIAGTSDSIMAILERLPEAECDPIAVMLEKIMDKLESNPAAYEPIFDEEGLDTAQALKHLPLDIKLDYLRAADDIAAIAVRHHPAILKDIAKDWPAGAAGAPMLEFLEKQGFSRLADIVKQAVPPPPQPQAPPRRAFGSRGFSPFRARGS